MDALRVSKLTAIFILGWTIPLKVFLLCWCTHCYALNSVKYLFEMANRIQEDGLLLTEAEHKLVK